MKKEKTTMIKEDELKQIYGGCIEEPSLKTGPLTMEDILDPFLNGTLSKILCKWKQDSVVSLFLYLNSVFKHKHKLIHNQAPV